MLLRSGNFYHQFIHGLNQRAAPLTCILQITSSPVANKSISVDKIDEVSIGKVMDKHNSMESGMEFLTLRAMFAFAELK